MKHRRGLAWYEYLIALGLAFFTVILCVCLGSEPLPFRDTVTVIWNSIFGIPIPRGMAKAIILSLRLPRVLCAGLMGAALSLCGGAMQGLLRNPLADGSTLGVSSGASLGAALAILLGISLPGIPIGGTMLMAMIFAFLAMILILSLAYGLDKSLSTHTIILIGVIFSMFVSSLLSLLITFSGEKLRTITFWTMGSLSGVNYTQVLLLLGALLLFGGVLLLHGQELNAFAVGEENARHVGVPVRRVKLTIMVGVSALIGISVAIGGSIGFVGLVIPHITRMLMGPNHKRLLPASIFFGAIFLMLTDLAARTILSPLELPIGVVTSLIGAVVFVLIFWRSRKSGRGVC